MKKYISGHLLLSIPFHFRSDIIFPCKFSANISISYSPAGRSLLGETVTLTETGTQTEDTVSLKTDRPRPVNNIVYFFPTEI